AAARALPPRVGGGRRAGGAAGCGGAVGGGVTMTEAEWLECSDQMKMLTFVNNRGSKRKAVLYLLACCRRQPKGSNNKLNRKAFEAAEKHADGLLTDEQLWEARSRGRLGHCVRSSALTRNFDPMYAGITAYGFSARNAAEH